MTPPKRTRVTKTPPIPGWGDPKPIGQHPHAGQYAVVVNFRHPPAVAPFHLEHFREQLYREIGQRIPDAQDVTVHIRVLGAAGEASEFEGAAGL